MTNVLDRFTKKLNQYEKKDSSQFKSTTKTQTTTKVTDLVMDQCVSINYWDYMFSSRAN